MPPADQTPLYLEDLAPGMRLAPSRSITVTAEDIKVYARQFDPQPFHTDEEAAKATFFRGLAASGWHTASLTMKLLSSGELPLAGGIVGAGVENIRWPRPVRPDDELRVESEVLEVRPSKSRPQQGLVRIQTTTLNAQDQPVQIMVSTLVVPRRGS